jgi:parallel beta-helix repeat protein
MSFVSWLRNRMSARAPQRRAQRPSATRRFRPRLEALEARWVPSTLTVLNNLDSGAGSLRADIAAAASGDTIVFAPSLAGQTITLAYRELAIAKSLTIQGLGGGQLTISGGGRTRVFDVSGAGTNVTLSGLAITQGNAGSDPVDSCDGGGILNRGGSTLTISGCTLSNNRAQLEGGGIANLGATLNVINSTVSGNTVINYNGAFESHGAGGGVYSGRDNLGRDSQLSITDCTLSNNRAGSEGGGIYVIYTSTKIDGCTLSSNIALAGSAISNSSGAISLIVSNSLFSRNNNSSSFPIYGGWFNGGGDTFQ